MSINRASPHDILEAWQAGEINFKRAMRLTGCKDVLELVAAARSSGVELLGLSSLDARLLDRAARLIGNRLDTVAFWQRADEWEVRLAMMGRRAAHGDPEASLRILESLPSEPPEPGDEMPGDE